MKSPDMPSQILFLPGALGRIQLWKHVANLLSCPAHKEHVSWPGFYSIPSNPLVNGIDDLVNMVLAKVDQPTALVAQSMGGAIAATKRHCVGFRRLSGYSVGASPGGFGTVLFQNAWLPVLWTLGTRPWFGGRLLVLRAHHVFNESGEVVDETAHKQLLDFLAGFAEFVQVNSKAEELK